MHVYGETATGSISGSDRQMWRVSADGGTRLWPKAIIVNKETFKDPNAPKDIYITRW